ncbi:hypothetical protein Prudu_009731, partial [Prunus dulcis]
MDGKCHVVSSDGCTWFLSFPKLSECKPIQGNQGFFRCNGGLGTYIQIFEQGKHWRFVDFELRLQKFMELKNILEDQMATALWFFRFPPPWMAVVAPFLILMGLMGFGFFSIFLTSMVLILSTVFFTFCKQKPVLVEKLVEEKVLIRCDQSFSPCLEDASRTQHDEEETAALQKKEAQEEDWSFGDNAVQSPDCSDGSISDEDSLIEIALPGGYYVGHKEQESIFNLQQKRPGLSHQSIFQQHTLLELLAEINEMNEEENLIEIDLSMGSIKCS